MAKKNEKSLQRIKIVIVGLMFLLTYFLVNAQQYAYAFLIYLVLGGVSLFLYNSWSKISKFGDLEGLSDNWIKNAFIGLGLAIATIIIGKFVGFVGAIGIPNVPQSVVSSVARFIIIVPSAMIFESVFFLDSFMDFLQSKLGLSKYPSLIIMSVFASLFHYTAYGSSLQNAGGSFFSAGFMFFWFGWLAEKQNDLAGAITWHGGLNWWIAIGQGAFSIALIILGVTI